MAHAAASMCQQVLWCRLGRLLPCSRGTTEACLRWPSNERQNHLFCSYVAILTCALCPWTPQGRQGAATQAPAAHGAPCALPATQPLAVARARGAARVCAPAAAASRGAGAGCHCSDSGACSRGRRSSCRAGWHCATASARCCCPEAQRRGAASARSRCSAAGPCASCTAAWWRCKRCCAASRACAAAACRAWCRARSAGTSRARAAVRAGHADQQRGRWDAISAQQRLPAQARGGSRRSGGSGGWYRGGQPGQGRACGRGEHATGGHASGAGGAGHGGRACEQPMREPGSGAQRSEPAPASGDAGSAGRAGHRGRPSGRRRRAAQPQARHGRVTRLAPRQHKALAEVPGGGRCWQGDPVRRCGETGRGCVGTAACGLAPARLRALLSTAVRSGRLCTSRREGRTGWHGSGGRAGAQPAPAGTLRAGRCSSA